MPTPDDFAKGKPILASSLNWLMRQCKKVDRIQGVAPIEVVNTSNGILIRLATKLFEVRIGQTSGTISARSGTAAGSGSVVLQSFDGTNLSAGETVTAYLFSAASGGIPSGKYCVVARLLSHWWVIAVEC